MTKLEFHFYSRGGSGTSLKIFILKCPSVMAVNGGTLANKLLVITGKKNLIPRPHPAPYFYHPRSANSDLEV